MCIYGNFRVPNLKNFKNIITKKLYLTKLFHFVLFLIQKNLVKSGGTKKGEELAMNAPVSKGRDNYKTADVAKVIYTRWENNKKDKEILLQRVNR